ncbi:MAG: DNA-3-methyladenine glycosidase [Parcubacteria group bacterium]|nr:DNA-3-methyladenine glycosidase [Parcubacteria group bacterium]|tara:strand:- start:310 stop:933 length:624 start_codon:yes stop_codon:yes gene_type:complete
MPKKVLTHFQKHDPTLYSAIALFEGELRGGPEVKADLFSSLCRTIVGQQLSSKAARSIWQKFRTLFPYQKPTATHILALSDMKLRESGISFAKIRSIQDLSERVSNRSLRLNTLRTLSIEDAKIALQEVRGIGPWSSEMFLMFALGHEDIFSVGDLGLRKGIQKIYGHHDLPSVEAMEELAENWSPYRTYAACAIWSILDNQEKNRP